MDERASLDVMNYVESHYKGCLKTRLIVPSVDSLWAVVILLISLAVSLPSLIISDSSLQVCMWVLLAISVVTSDKQLQGNEEAKKQLATLFKNKPKLYWIGMGKTDFLYKSSADLRRY